MPYFDNLDTYINPYYLDVTPSVRAEMYKRAQYYGSKTRTGINSSLGSGLSNSVEWPYQKMPWAYVTSRTFSDNKEAPIVLGFDLSEKDGIKTNSDVNGNLTLYDSQRNVPKYPLLTFIEISNEGQRGALLKGKFGFTFFPGMLSDGFALEAIQRIFFTPGNRVNIGFGWSTPAYDPKVNKLEFVGIIYGFNWSFNQNMSITAEVQVVAPSTLSLGLSGEQTVFEQNDETELVMDPTGRPLPPKTNLITIIQRDLLHSMTSDPGINVSATGLAEFVPKTKTFSQIFNYFKIGLPTVVGSSFEDAAATRLAMSDQDKQREKEEQLEERIEQRVEEILTESPEITETTPAQDNVVNPKPDKATDGGLIVTSWNVKYKETASQQLKRFLNSFIQNKGKNQGTPEERKWLSDWKNAYKNKTTGQVVTMGRYIYHEQLKDNFTEAYWASGANLSNSQIPEFKVNSFDEFVTKSIYGKKDDTYENQVKIIKRKIAELGALELEELKNFAYYNIPIPPGYYGGSDNNKRAYLKFFYITKKDQGDIKAGTLQRDKYLWPDNLKFVVYDTTGKEVTLTMSDIWNNFNNLQSVKDLRSEYDGKYTDDANNKKYLDAVKERTKDFETILNRYITNSLYFSKGMTSDSSDIDKKSDGETQNKKPKEKVTPEEKQRLDTEISELKSLQSRVSNANVFKTDNNNDFKKFEEDYPDDRFVGGVDVQSIKQNWLLKFEYAKGTTNELIPPQKSAWVSKFIQKLIDARTEQKNTGTDTVKDLINPKSTRYQDRLNGTGDQPDGGGTDGGGTDGGGGGGDVGGDPAEAQQFQSQLVGQTYWYITLKDLVEFANEMMKVFEDDTESKKYNFQKFRIMCENNETEYQPSVKSAYPQNVYFPDISMGGYQTFNPFYDNEYSDYLRTFRLNENAPTDMQAENISQDKDGNRIRIEDDVINVGNILIGINLVLGAYRGFLVDNATNISYKNITSFFDVIIREINAASGDTYQLVSHLFTEPEKLSPKYTPSDQIGDSAMKGMSVLSIEDTHIARKHSQTIKANETISGNNRDDSDTVTLNEDIYSVKPFVFEATIFKPLIKNVQISSRPPKELAFAAYIAARGQEANDRGGDFREKSLAKPYSGDANVLRPTARDNAEYEKQGKKNDDEKTREENAVGTQGFTQEWCDNYRSILSKLKRLTIKASTTSGRSIGVGGHWLNKAIYPVEFTVTIDGINGFKFGDVLKTTMIPRHYNVDWDMVFTVTKILHKVTPSSWETTLNTAARLSLDSPLTGIQVTADPLKPDQRLPDYLSDVYGPNREEMNR